MVFRSIRNFHYRSFRPAVFVGLLTICAGTTGCLSETQTTPPVPVSSAPATKSVGNADYECWARFAPGTRVVRRKTLTNAEGTTMVTTTLRLVSVGDAQVEVESQITVDRKRNDPPWEDSTVNPPDVVRFSANYQIPEEMSEDQFRSPLPDAKWKSKEVLTVLGVEYEADVYEWKATLESGPVPVRGWFSNEFPGRQLRLEFFYNDSAGSTGIDEVIDLEVAS